MTEKYVTVKIIEDELSADFTNTTDPSRSAVLRYIEEVQDRIDEYAGKQFSTQVVTDEVRDFDGQDYIVVPSGTTSIQSIEYKVPPSTSWETLSPDNYVFYPEFDKVEKEAYTADAWPVGGQKVLRLSYTVGDDDNIPSYVKELARDMVVLRVIKKAMQQEAQVAGGGIQVGPIRLTGTPQSVVNRVSRLEKGIHQELNNLARSKAYSSPEKNW